jgi:AcrR family transcriptional regulator
MPQRARRSAAETRAEIRRVALELFTERGFDATTTRDIAAVLGMNQSSLYYHFRSKDEIVRDLMEERRRDVDAFLAWLKTQEGTPGLLRTAALRWIDQTTDEYVHGQRFAQANVAAQRRLSNREASVPAAFEQVVSFFTDEHTPSAEVLYINTIFGAVGAVLTATFGSPIEPADILAAARRMVLAMTADGRDR